MTFDVVPCHCTEVMLLDEPTTGLDCLTANHIVSLLSDLAHKDRIVIITIHQPRSELFRVNEIYSLFGFVGVFFEGGECWWVGCLLCSGFYLFLFFLVPRVFFQGKSSRSNIVSSKSSLPSPLHKHRFALNVTALAFYLSQGIFEHIMPCEISMHTA